MSTSCSPHVTSVLLHGSCWWGRLAPLANGAPCQVRRASGSQPPALLSLLEMCLLQSARSCHVCLADRSAVSASLSVPYLHYSSTQGWQLHWGGRSPALLSGPASWQFSLSQLSIRHCLCGIATSP
ncbi:hypothetical protein HJG60_011937 [Phyllostomus discolor]|uniref:Uncharacterized protein n=1 Tax=Phyllostomus discolor TaxID=89673 RepID=A0A833ZPP6_9CHIR|nr:hypothetical protein HJG60_011937 [Phyllostomus discolor]